MNKKIIKRLILPVILVLITVYVFWYANNSFHKVASFYGTVTYSKVAEHLAGATADGMVGGGTFYYIYVEFDDKVFLFDDNVQVVFKVPEPLYYQYSKGGDKVEIELLQSEADELAQLDNKARLPQNYRFFIDKVEVTYSYFLPEERKVTYRNGII